MVGGSTAISGIILFWGSQINEPQTMMAYPDYIFQYFIYLLLPSFVGIFAVAAYFSEMLK